MNYEELIRKLVDKKANEDNRIDLHVYERGMRDITEMLAGDDRDDNNLAVFAAPVGSLILSPESSVEECEKLYKEWMNDTFDKK